MKTVDEDRSPSWDDAMLPNGRAETSEGPQEEAAVAAADDPELQMLDEPGYGHGV